jgi:hypothetical protein
MFICKTPRLEPAPLTKQILEAMRDQPLREQDARYAPYSDGVLVGCALWEEDLRIGVERGLVKYSGRIYVLAERAGVVYRPTDNWTALKIRFAPEQRTRDFSTYTGELALDETLFSAPNELELGRFKLKAGSRLRTEYENFRDMATEYDTMNVLHARQAGVPVPALHPLILRQFAQEAYPGAERADDVAFCSACYSGPVSREYITRYIGRRLGKDALEAGNEELFEYLAEMLDEIKGRGKKESGAGEEGYMLL